MIVCDRCGKQIAFQSSLIMERKTDVLAKMETGRIYPASFDPFIKSETHFDLCQECLDDVFKNLREFVNQGKFKGELNNG